MAGQRQKPRGELAFKRGGRDRVLEETPEELRAVLPMPEGLSPEAQFVWNETVPMAMKHFFPTDFFHIRRWIFWVNEFVKTAAEVVEEGSVVRGALGSDVLNPRARYLQNCEMNLQRLEASIGLNPQARMRHGITFATEQSALDKLKGRGERPKAKPMSFPTAAGT